MTMPTEGEIKRYIEGQVREACEPMLDEMRATDELLPLFPENDLPEVDWNDEDNIRVPDPGAILFLDVPTETASEDCEDEPVEQPPLATLYQLGPEEIGDLDSDRHWRCKYQWVIYWYESGCYEGSGNAISWDGTTLRHHDLGHCSCYGPEDGLNDGDVVTVEDLTSESVLDQYREDLVEKALELLGVDQ